MTIKHLHELFNGIGIGKKREGSIDATGTIFFWKRNRRAGKGYERAITDPVLDES